MPATVYKRLVFETRNIEPASSQVLGTSYPRTTEGVSGGGFWNVGIIKLPKRSTRLSGIIASLAENQSNVGKSVKPIIGFSLHIAGSKTVNFLSNITESKFPETALELDGVPINTHSDCNIEMNDQFVDLYPRNVIEFSSDINRDILFLPRSFNGLPSVVDELETFKTISFQDFFSTNVPINIPAGGEYLLITPYATAPVPQYVYITSSGTISVAINFNAELEDR